MILGDYELHEIDVDNDDDLAAYVSAIHRFNTAEWGDLAQLHGLGEFRLAARSPQNEIHYFSYRSTTTGDIAAVMEVIYPQHHDVHIAEAYICVDDSLQGYGFGRVLADAVEIQAREHGRTVIAGDISSRSRRDNRDSRFVLRRGFRQEFIVLRQDITLPLIPANPGANIGPVQDYVIQTCWGEPPQDWLAELADLDMRDDDRFQATTAAEINATFQAAIGSGVHVLTMLLRAKANHRIYGWIHVEYSGGQAIAELSTAFSDRSLGAQALHAAFILRSLAELSCAFPEVKRVRSFHQSTDTELLMAFDLLGFETTAYYKHYRKTLTPH
ncbi:MAG: hypothetical protein ACRCWS_05255 [Propionibacteriaceae bacterium]